MHRNKQLSRETKTVVKLVEGIKIIGTNYLVKSNVSYCVAVHEENYDFHV